MDVQPISSPTISFTETKEDLENDIKDMTMIMNSVNLDSAEYEFYNRKVQEAEDPNFKGYTIEHSNSNEACSWSIPCHVSGVIKG